MSMRNSKLQNKYDVFVSYFKEHNPQAASELVFATHTSFWCR